jgi:hypothetical protein
MSVAKTTTAGAHVARYDRLQCGGYFADFRRDRRLTPEVYHCVIQRDGSTEILLWSQFHSLDEAREFAEKHLQHLAGEQANKAS